MVDTVKKALEIGVTISKGMYKLVSMNKYEIERSYWRTEDAAKSKRAI